MYLPTAYRPGHEKARRIDPEMADLYIKHTTMGDEAADAAIAACADFDPRQQRTWIKTGIESGAGAIPDAPEALRAVIAASERAPEWFDAAKTRAGSRVFHGNSETFLQAFVGAVLIEGFCTLIAKSFAITGRLVDQGVRRMKQNNRHVSEIFLPGGLDTFGDGWTASVRIRLIHARVRALMKESPDWEADAWGTPLSSAHIAYANAAFSGLLLKRARMLGLDFLSDDERDSFMHCWRCSGHLVGVHPDLLCATEDEALRLQRIGEMCEPPPDIESILVANGLVNSAPIIVGITDTDERRALAKKVYRVSRAMIGDELADQLRFPKYRTFGVLAAMRLRFRADRLLRRAFPGLDRRRRAGQFGQLVELSFHETTETPYALPQHLYAERDRPDSSQG
ncbi:oxygenase MpaB family protein [Fodinicurvata sp. EGI_FJ10296]|uniref:oxygenase MpaB family protein n=1 Tax=Fodinicurvata sp. EGI_FJ10296 TaxID=3231908 RepID=UPI003452D944